MYRWPLCGGGLYVEVSLMYRWFLCRGVLNVQVFLCRGGPYVEVHGPYKEVILICAWMCACVQMVRMHSCMDLA